MTNISPLPPSESPDAVTDAVRLAALARTRLLDSPPEEAFDRLTRLAQRILKAPVTLVSLVDAHRQFFKSAQGLEGVLAEERATPLSHSLCRYVVGRGEPLCIDDADEDERFRDHPAVRDLDIRAYLGVPLTTSDGQVLGSFCAVDSEARAWTRDELEILSDLGASVMTEIEIRLSLQDLGESRERFDRAVQGSRDGLWDWDLDTGFLYLSPRSKEMLGYEEGEVENTPEAWRALLHPEDYPETMRRVEAAVGGEAGEYRAEYRMRQKDGSYRWVLARGVVFKDAAGKVLRMSGSHTDITERKRAEQEMERANRFIQRVSDAAPLVIYVLDLAQERILYNNRMAGELMGCPPGEGADAGILEAMLHPEDLAAFPAHRARLLTLADGEPADWEYRLRHRDGTYRWMRSRDTVFARNPGGVPTQILGMAEDVTERREMEDLRRSLLEEMRAARDAAVDSAHAKSAFLANMSHEIRTPMNGVLGMTSLLLDTPLTPEQHEYARVVQNSAESLLTILNDILDLSKIESGSLTVESIPFDLKATVEEVIRLLAPRARQKGLDLICDLPPGLLAKGLRGDPFRLRQILLNLGGNAVKFTERGWVIFTGSLAEETETHLRVNLTVRDTGIGIPADRQETVFESFRQADGSTTRRYGGTGLGLTISRHLARLMGGDVRVRSVPGEGSDFTIELLFEKGEAAPVAAVPPAGLPALFNVASSTGPAAAAVAATAAATPMPTSTLPVGVRVLLAEDNLVNRRVAVALLEKWACRVTAVETGEEAAARVEERAGTPEAFHLVLMDMQMPDMDGLTATARIRETERQLGSAPVPIIALTAHAMTGDRERCLGVGMNDYVSKPVRPADLLTAMAGQLGSGGDPRAAAAEAPEAAVHSTAAPTLKIERLRESCGDDDEIMEAVIEDYRAKTPGLLGRLSEAVRAGDPEAVRFSAHTIKGSSRTVGAERLADLCEQMETDARAWSAPASAALLSEALAEWPRVDAALLVLSVSAEG